MDSKQIKSGKGLWRKRSLQLLDSMNPLKLVGKTKAEEKTLRGRISYPFLVGCTTGIDSASPPPSPRTPIFIAPRISGLQTPPLSPRMNQLGKGKDISEGKSKRRSVIASRPPHCYNYRPSYVSPTRSSITTSDWMTTSTRTSHIPFPTSPATSTSSFQSRPDLATQLISSLPLSNSHDYSRPSSTFSYDSNYSSTSDQTITTLSYQLQSATGSSEEDFQPMEFEDFDYNWDDRTRNGSEEDLMDSSSSESSSKCFRDSVPFSFDSGYGGWQEKQEISTNTISDAYPSPPTRLTDLPSMKEDLESNSS